MGAGGLPVPPRQRLQAQFAAQQRQAQQAAAEEGVGGAEGNPGRPLDLQGPLNELMGMLQRVLDLIPGAGRDSGGYEGSSDED